MLGMLELFFVIVQLIGVAFLIFFWLYFLLIERKDPEKSQIYIAHESSFPLADLLWLAPCLLIAAIGLIIEQRFGIFFTIVSGGVQIFLGLLDLSFNLQQGQYKGTKSDTILNIVIQVYCFIVGAIFLIYGYLNL
ncbi:MAG: hypothetical protein ACFE9C_05235 [Candidatus Hodarchaeota archaeon]